MIGWCPYWFYVTCEIPERKDPRAVDEKLIEKYGLGIGKATRARRKAAGLANIQYLRHRRGFVLLTTPGRHPFFEEERKFIRDAREVPIKFAGYSISYRAGHPHVRIEQGRYLELKAYLADIAVHRTKERLEEEFHRLPFEPYAPVRSQLFGVLREVNRRRQLAGYTPVSSTCLCVRRQVVRPFELPHAVVPSESPELSVQLYQRVKHNTKMHGKAAVAVARHLAEASYWMLKKQEGYREPKSKRQVLSSTHG
jgi:hypothetical protein